MSDREYMQERFEEIIDKLDDLLDMIIHRPDCECRPCERERREAKEST